MTDVVDGTINARPRAGVHYHLCTYVCGPACLKPSPFEGWATFAQIFQQRPDGCRFAIARLVPVFESAPDGAFLCWDLWDDRVVMHQRHRVDGLLRPPPPLWTGNAEDGLVMKAMALYEKGSGDD